MGASAAAAWPVDASGRLAGMHVFADTGDGPILAGVIRFEGARGRLGTFRYDRDWLARPDAHALAATGLPLRTRACQSVPPHELPLPLYDASPDGWGKAILSMAYPDISMAAPEYIAAAGGDRVGHLQFGPDASGPALWVPSPALLDLPNEQDDLAALADAADAVEAGIATASHLARLLDSAADIGGARPKARIQVEGEAWIAKMRARDDAFDHQRVEAACLSVAREAGIETPDHQVTEVAGRSVLLVRRFDRQGPRRLPYSSAATVLGYPPGTYRPDGASYADLAIMARRAGILDCARDLYERLLLNCFLNNTDDHLHNHAFIDDGHGWHLSPVFDIVPQAARALVLRPARGWTAEADPAQARTAHERFGLSAADAAESFDRIQTAAARLSYWLSYYGVGATDRAVVMRRVRVA